MQNEAQNILVFTNTLKKGGAELQSIYLAQALLPNHSVWLAIFYGDMIHPELIEKVQKSNIPYVLFSGQPLKVPFELVKFIKSHNIDCIYSFLFTTNCYSAIWGRLSGVRYIIGGFRSSDYSGIKLVVQRFLHNHVNNASIVNSFCGRRYLVKRGLKEKSLFVVHNAFIGDAIQHQVNKVDRIQIISVGRFVKEKDYFTALQVIKRVHEINPIVHFNYLMIGYGELEKMLRNFIINERLEDYVQMIINPNNVSSYLSQSDIFLQTSLVEGTSNSILEAMYAHLPIVATNVGDNSYLVKSDNGFLSPIGAIDELANNLNILLHDKSLRERMGEKGYKIVNDFFSFDAFRDNNLNILEKIQTQ